MLPFLQQVSILFQTYKPRLYISPPILLYFFQALPQWAAYHLVLLQLSFY